MVLDPWLTAGALGDVLAVTRAPASVWQARQRLRLGALIQAVRTASPWWAARLAGAALDAASTPHVLASLPVSRKRDLMARWSDWVTEPSISADELRAFARARGGSGEAYRGRWLVWESSGSSGEPALFVQDAKCLAVNDALEAARGPVAQLGGLLAGALASTRFAFVGAIDGPFASIVSLQRLRALNPWARVAMKPFSFLQPIESLVSELEAWRPAVLATYPSMAWVLARRQARGRLALKLRAVWTGGETLTPAVRAMLQQTFGCPVHDTYGASECLNIAAECPAGALHLHADWVILEPVSEAFEPLPAGEAGATTLLTSLANTVQPIIRYDLGDRVRIVPGRCGCGCELPVIEVQGRADDVLSLDAGRGRSVDLAPLALTTVLEDEAGLFDFRIVQRGARSLRLDLFGAAPGGAAAAAGILRRFLRTQGVVDPRVRVHRLADEPERGHSGKQRRVCRLRTSGLPRSTR